MADLATMTGGEDVASVTPQMLKGVTAAADCKDAVAGLLRDAAHARYGIEGNKRTFRSVAARLGGDGDYTVYVLVDSDVPRVDRVEIEKAWTKDVS